MSTQVRSTATTSATTPAARSIASAPRGDNATGRPDVYCARSTDQRVVPAAGSIATMRPVVLADTATSASTATAAISPVPVVDRPALAAGDAIERDATAASGAVRRHQHEVAVDDRPIEPGTFELRLPPRAARTVDRADAAPFEGDHGAIGVDRHCARCRRKVHRPVRGRAIGTRGRAGCRRVGRGRAPRQQRECECERSRSSRAHRGTTKPLVSGKPPGSVSARVIAGGTSDARTTSRSDWHGKGRPSSAERIAMSASSSVWTFVCGSRESGVDDRVLRAADRRAVGRDDVVEQRTDRRQFDRLREPRRVELGHEG